MSVNSGDVQWTFVLGSQVLLPAWMETRKICKLSGNIPAFNKAKSTKLAQCASVPYITARDSSAKRKTKQVQHLFYTCQRQILIFELCRVRACLLDVQHLTLPELPHLYFILSGMFHGRRYISTLGRAVVGSHLSNTQKARTITNLTIKCKGQTIYIRVPIAEIQQLTATVDQIQHLTICAIAPFSVQQRRANWSPWHENDTLTHYKHGFTTRTWVSG